MIKQKNKSTKSKIEIDLTGPQGNAFFILGYASRLANELGLDKEKILTEMKSSDYENLINVFDRYFGDFVILYR